MKIASRVIVAASILGALAFCFFLASYDSATEKPEPGARLPPMTQLSALVNQEQKLKEQVEESLQRVEAKDAIVRAVIAGQLTLLEAAARFRDLNASWAEARAYLQKIYPGLPYEHALCRQVIAHVEAEVRRRGDRDCVLSCLEAELAEHLGQHGQVCLPEVGS